MSRILDFYAVRWEYEPHTFPILWNLDGDVVESFSPDFYLPDLDLYLEMTTLRQKLVRKKNRKLRRLRELYPDVRIKLFYTRDFRALMLKYGKVGLADGLSGSLGQMVPVPATATAESMPGMVQEELAPVDLAGPDREPVAPDRTPVAAPLAAGTTRSAASRRNARRSRRRHTLATGIGTELRETATTIAAAAAPG